MKKITIIPLAAAVVLLLAAGVYFVLRANWFRSEDSNTNSTDNSGISGEAVEYDESMGEVCPLGVKLLGAREANPIGCRCPEGYEMESQIIGYATDDSCYGEGTECPIMSSECRKE